jgi:hypothetical protein
MGQLLLMQDNQRDDVNYAAQQLGKEYISLPSTYLASLCTDWNMVAKWVEGSYV